jgi:hypothetical protein
MKKSIVLAILGGTMAVASSYAQGIINFNSYGANAGAGALTTFLSGGAAVPDGFTAQLYFALGTVSDPVQSGNAASILSPITGLTAVGSPVLYDTTAASGGAFPGYFQGGNVIIPGYTSGPVTFEVLTTGVVGSTDYQGRSGSFTMASIPSSANPAIPMSGMPNWQVAPVVVPEPTTLALAGLGGLASLIALRRKQA